MSTKTDLKRLEAQYGALQAIHEGADPKAFQKYRDDPVGFIEKVLGGKLYDAQKKIACDVRDFPQVAVKSANGAGKDWLAARLALWWVYARRGLALLSGPTLRQVREVCMAEISRAWTDELPGELFTHALRVPGSDGAGILAYTSSEVSRMTGHHSERVMAIMTEGQGVEPHGYEAMYACALGDEDKFLVLGNPLSRSGEFARLFDSDVWEKHTISAFDIPNVAEGKVIIPGAMTRAGVNRIEATYGKGSSIYASRVLGLFPEEDEEALIRRSWLELAAEKYTSGDWDKNAEPTISLDPARYGSDLSACAVRRGMALVELVTWGQSDTMETVAKVEALCAKHGVVPDRTNPRRSTRSFPSYGSIVIDVIGLGAGVHDRLKEKGFQVLEFNAARRPSRGKDKFQNLRADSFWRLREGLENGELAIPKDPLLWDELTAIKWDRSTGKIRIEPKDNLRLRLGRSCDRADSLAMAFCSGALDRRAYLFSTHTGKRRRIA